MCDEQDAVNVDELEQIAERMGEASFKHAVTRLYIRIQMKKQALCEHDYKLSQIADDGYTCYKCGSWKSEED